MVRKHVDERWKTKEELQEQAWDHEMVTRRAMPPGARTVSSIGWLGNALTPGKPDEFRWRWLLPLELIWCHLLHKGFNDDRDESQERALREGVEAHTL